MPGDKGYGDSKYGSKTASGKPRVYSQFNEAGRKYVTKKPEATGKPSRSGDKPMESDSTPIKVEGGIPAHMRARHINIKKY